VFLKLADYTPYFNWNDQAHIGKDDVVCLLKESVEAAREQGI